MLNIQELHILKTDELGNLQAGGTYRITISTAPRLAFLHALAPVQGACVAK